MIRIDGEYENNPDNYINSRTPNTAELARLLLKAKGVNRNMAEFATICEASASTFSRIANCKISQPVAKDLLVRIANNADPESGVQACHLFHANGMVTKDFANRKIMRGGDFFGDEEFFSRENEIKNMLVADLVERGNQIQLLQRIDDDSASSFVRSGSGRTNLLLCVSGCEAPYWKFRIMGMQGFSYVGGKRGPKQEIRRNYKAEAKMLLSRLAEVFLEDVWNPERLKICKMSFVFWDYEYYKEFNELILDKKFNNWFSTIYVDMIRKHVVEEYVFERYDGRVEKSPLNYPLMSNTDDDWGTDDDEFYGSIYGEDGFHEDNDGED